MSVGDTPLARRDWERAAGPEFLAQVPLFAKLRPRHARKVARDVELAAFLPGDVVLDDGASADFFYVVLRGEAQVRGERETRTVRSGEYFGETGLLDETNRSVTVVATNELQLLRLPGSVFVRLLRQNPAVAYAVLKHVGDQVRGGDPRLISRAA
jgi:CPA1 family monovalent cation:H+ antiporter